MKNSNLSYSSTLSMNIQTKIYRTTDRCPLKTQIIMCDFNLYVVNFQHNAGSVVKPINIWLALLALCEFSALLKIVETQQLYSNLIRFWNLCDPNTRVWHFWNTPYNFFDVHPYLTILNGIAISRWLFFLPIWITFLLNNRFLLYQDLFSTELIS